MPSLLLCTCLPLRSTFQRERQLPGQILRWRRMRSTVRSTETSSMQRAQWQSRSAANTRMSLLLHLERRQWPSARAPLRQAIEPHAATTRRGGHAATARTRSSWSCSCAICCQGLIHAGSPHRGIRAADLKASAAGGFQDSALTVTLDHSALEERSRGSSCLLCTSTRTRRGRARRAVNFNVRRRPLCPRPGHRTSPIGIAVQAHGARSRRCANTS